MLKRCILSVCLFVCLFVCWFACVLACVRREEEGKNKITKIKIKIKSTTRPPNLLQLQFFIARGIKLVFSVTVTVTVFNCFGI